MAIDIPERVEEFLDGIYEEISGELEECEYCSSYTVTKDPFSTGDSPTEYSCEVVNERECPYVREAIDYFVLIANRKR